MHDAETTEAAAGPKELIPRPETLHGNLPKDELYRILSLDGRGAKGVYTLGVLKEIEGWWDAPSTSGST
jgi:hypothetical protein